MNVLTGKPRLLKSFSRLSFGNSLDVLGRSKMKWIFTLSIFVWFGLSLAAPTASCQTHVDLTYCLAPSGQTVVYTAQIGSGFTAVLFAEEAEVEGNKQSEFAGTLKEGSTVVFQGGIVLVMPIRVAEVLELQAELYTEVLGQPSNQPLVICVLMKAGDGCESAKSRLQPWSVGIRIVRNQGSPLGYGISFHSRGSVSSTPYTLPTTPLKENEPPSIWIVLSQQALARFYKPSEDWGNCQLQQVCG